MGKKKNNDVEITENVISTPKIKEDNSNVELNVLVEFIDKYNGKLYKVGSVLNVDKARADELLADSRKLVEKK